MPVYYGLGKSVVSEKRYRREMRSSNFALLTSQIETNLDAVINISGHNVSIEEVLRPKDSSGTPFEPIEFGKPLTVEIRWVYTGNKPIKAWGRKTKDMLVTSAFKSIATFNEAPRAVNLVRRQVEAFSNICWAATDKGTKLAFYTPAVTEPATLATFEITFDNFPDETVRKLGDAISQCAGIPLFAAASVYLISGGSLIKLLADAGHTIFDGKTAFRSTETIAFAHPGSQPTPAGWRILTQETLDDDFLLNLQIGKEGQLLGADGKPYAGDFPYVVISLDGREMESYKQFMPTAASASLLDKFFGSKDKETTPIDHVLDGLKLYSDYRFRIQADKAKEALEKTKPDSPEYEKKKKELDALKANILHEELKLS